MWSTSRSTTSLRNDEAVALPDPKPGLVIRYDYLWTHEAAAGRDHGKTRPTCLIAATDPAVRPRYVVLLPITLRV